MSIKTKADAQKKVDQIVAFQNELEELRHDNVLVLTESQHSGLIHHHSTLISQMKEVYDVDASKREKQLSIGMKISSFLGALALGASIFFLFYQFWGHFPTAIQVTILLISPLSGALLTMFLTMKFSDGYYSKLAAMVTFACFVLNLLMLGRIFNITPSENAFMVWSAFAFVLAYAADARLLLATGIISLACFLSARAGTWFGCYWIHFGERPENFFFAAVLLFLVPLVFKHKKFSEFPIIYRVFAMIIFFIPVLILSNWGYASYLYLHPNIIEAMYQIIGFFLSGVAIWAGIRYGWQDTVNTGNVFFVILLYTKFFDWWWDWMPKYLFFLVIGLTSILFLVVFKRIRNYQAGLIQEEST